ncbi:MAG: helix-turn-helix domain-containing protein [Gammaproteobacteria bacterium]|nr:MAG: helix-turn-helix domain-containing protein [Gammaproteobacteria bacterium]
MSASAARVRRRPHHVVMLAYPDVQILDVTGPLEVFSRAARWMQDHGLRRDLAYRVEVVAPRAGAFVSRLGSVCTGALLLASSGLLEGRRATTHWAYLEELKKSVGHGVCHDAIYTRDGNIYTSAGVTAGMDMALAMLEEDHGNAVALAVARELVLFLKRPGGQSQFSDYLAAQFSEDAGLRELQLWMLEHLDQDLSVPRLAERIAMSERSFARHFVDGVGLAPGHYVRQIRLTAARQRLEQTDLPLQQIARRCGFGTPESLRRSFIASVGVTPGAYRDRFRGAARPAS